MPPLPLSRAKALTGSRARSWEVVARVGAGLPILGAVAIAAASFISATPVKAQPAGGAGAPVTSAVAPKQSVSKPLWRDLTARQQRALTPLAPHWDSLSEPHKRKWLAMSRNYAKLPQADQEILHSRMTDWAALSNQQRAQARLNFAEVKQVLPVDERKAKWEAYQALSEEEKGRLASLAAPRPPGAAPTIRPVPAQKLAPVPAISSDGQHTARIQLAPPAAAPTKAMLTVPVGPPVSAEAQVPSPSELSQAQQTTPAVEAPAAAIPPVRVTEQPSSAP
jgi:hypothetical protein